MPTYVTRTRCKWRLGVRRALMRLFPEKPFIKVASTYSPVFLGHIQLEIIHFALRSFVTQLCYTCFRCAFKLVKKEEFRRLSKDSKCLALLGSFKLKSEPKSTPHRGYSSCFVRSWTHRQGCLPLRCQKWNSTIGKLAKLGQISSSLRAAVGRERSADRFQRSISDQT